MQILPFFLYVFVMAFTPGPNNILSMSNAKRYGYKRTLRFIVGVTLGFFSVLLVCAYFNLILFRIIPEVKWAMRVLGGVYMTFLAIKIMRSKVDTTPIGSL